MSAVRLTASKALTAPRTIAVRPCGTRDLVSSRCKTQLPARFVDRPRTIAKGACLWKLVDIHGCITIWRNYMG